ncbi:MATE family efflux transporter [Salidesulfovibrio brasiliensis]|uniref:MATE family efflux transporter n=1 Tax=Salidesulfovibrio brasiliensis TaxID=221711 RepID=UPI0006D1FBDA|nr:MATE family efflux transporter [Salidesulfovibrio brasiliensis]
MIHRWSAPNGYREALKIGLPLVISMASTTLMIFADRMFLGWYSVETLAASFPATISYFLFYSFFLGTLEYVSVFVAQYTGADRPERVGAAVWQGLYFVIPASVFMIVVGIYCGELFELAGHSADIRQLEVDYFQTLSFGSVFGFGAVALSCFFSGRGITRPVMVANMLSALVNIPLNYCLINGYGGFPELGITGAALATACAYFVNFAVMAGLVFRAKYEECYKIRSARRFDPNLFRRFLKYGLPGGAQFFLDMLAISYFGVVVGWFDWVGLAATNIAIGIDTLAFLPAIGMSIACSVMVGQAMGRGKPEEASYAMNSVMHLTLVYMGFMGLLFVLVPDMFVNWFRSENLSDAEWAAVLAAGVVLMRWVAAYTILDAVVMSIMGLLKGAGDTRFIMKTMGLCSVFGMILPLTVLVKWMGFGYQAAWACLLMYVVLLTGVFYWRYRSGVWRDLDILERGDS